MGESGALPAHLRPGPNFLLTAALGGINFTDSRLPATFFREEEVGTGYFALFGKLSGRLAPCGAEVSGRSLLASDFAARRTTAHVAQSVEHLHGKQKVSGSIPLVGSILRIANVTSFKNETAPAPRVR